jgi:HEAT repeat protein
MGKRVKVALVVLTVALVGAIVWQVAQPREPVYQGKLLSEWLKYLPPTPATQGTQHQLQARTAVRQIGTNAIPTLLRLLRAEDSALKVRVVDLLQRQRVVKIEFTPAQEWNQAASCGFAELGTNAQGAVPALREILDEKQSSLTLRAIGALISIGPPARDAVPSILRWATNADCLMRYEAISALGSIHAQPERAVPVLVNALNEPTRLNERVLIRETAALSLARFAPDAKSAVPALVEFLNTHDDSWRIIPQPLPPTDRAGMIFADDSEATIHSRPFVLAALRAIDPEAAAKVRVFKLEASVAVPALIECLHHPQFDVRSRAARALGGFGSEAKLAVPALIEALSASEDSAREWQGAAAALSKIDPEAAVSALITIAGRNISNADASDFAIDELVSLGPPAKEAVPSLMEWATNSDWYVRYHAIRALGKIRAEPDRVVPVLMSALADPNANVHICAVQALENFGPNAKPAVTTLMEWLHDPAHDVSAREYATKALRAIDPDAAAKAGITNAP